MPKATVNNQEVEFEPGMTVLQVCELAGEEIPRFCYHERLSIAGNCRMCLVEIKGGPPKPAASCAMPAGDGMEIHTNTPMVKKAREGVMEFLLINHPLDCPICDQGGECDLQDQAMAYGRGQDRFEENKRSVKDKNMGPLIKTHMTRCIHCTRCVRFCEDVAGVEELGAIGRGENMQITSYLEKAVTNELSGNVIDLCPVGALTSKPYAFKARPWELKKTETIDVMDAVGSNIRVDARGPEVMRILPRLNEDINEEWISDKTRFAYDGLKYQRLDRPFIRKKGKLTEASWEEAFEYTAKRLKGLSGDKVAGIVGDLVDAESMFAFKKLLEALGSPHIDCRQDGTNQNAADRASYLFNTGIAGIEESDACLIIGANPRLEASLINARIGKRALKRNYPVGVVGENHDLTYKTNYLGDSVELLEEKSFLKSEFGKQFKAAEKPIVIIGMDVFKRNDSDAVLDLISKLCKVCDVVTKDWNGYNVLNTAASRVAGLDLGLVPAKGGKGTIDILEAAKRDVIEVVYLLGADEIEMEKLESTFVIYQGHHGDKGAHAADVIFPGAAYTEKDGTYVNTEGRVQWARRAVFAPGQAKDDIEILAELAKALGNDLELSNRAEANAAMVKAVPHLAELNSIQLAKWKAQGKEGKTLKAGLSSAVENFYYTNPICRASKTMAECVDVIVNANKDNKSAA